MHLRHRQVRPQYKVGGRSHGNTWTAEPGYRPDVEMKRNRLLYLQLFSSPGKFKYAVLGSVVVVLHQFTIEKPTEGSWLGGGWSLGRADHTSTCSALLQSR